MTAVQEAPASDKTPSTPVVVGDRPRRGWPAAIPVVVFMGIFFVYPILRVIGDSVGYPDSISLSAYREILTSPTYRYILWVTIQLALLTVVVTVAFGYPLAYAMVRAKPLARRFIILVLIIPFMTSILIRMFGWMVLLAPGGLVPSALAGLGLGEVQLLYNRPAVVIGMSYSMFPYVVFPLYASMLTVDERLRNAAMSLGANGWQVFRRIYLPLSVPGLVAGSALAFLLSLGFFYTPILMGGPRDRTVASVIENLVSSTLDARTPSAFAVILLLFVLVGIGFVSRFMHVSKLFDRKIS